MTNLVPENEQQYGSILTVLGENAEQNGKLLNKQVEFTHIAFGDANDTYVQPDRKAQALVNELHRIPVNSVDVLQPTPDSVPILKVEAILPDDINDVVIREFAAVATFNGQTYFHAIGNCARVYVPKPINNGNVSNPVTLEMTFVITSADPIVEIDPNVVTASREFVHNQINKSDKNKIESAAFATLEDAIATAQVPDEENGVPYGSFLKVSKGIEELKKKISNKTSYSIIGYDPASSSIKHCFENDYAVDIENGVGLYRNLIQYKDFRLFGDDEIQGQKGIKITGTSILANVENFISSRLDEVLNFEHAYVSLLKGVRIMYSHNPMKFTVPNGQSGTGIYVQRYSGNAFSTVDQLTGHYGSMVFEYGLDESGNALAFSASQCVTVESLYTEGGVSKALALTFKNQRKNLNFTLNKAWLNESKVGGQSIDASYSSAAIFGGLISQTPQVDYVIKAPLHDDIVYVDNVLQIDQNANGYIGDVRGEGQPIKPLSNDNRKMMVCRPGKLHGDGTNDDLANIQVNTANDINGIKPRLYNVAPRFDIAASLSDFNIVNAGTSYTESSGAFCFSEHYGSVLIGFEVEMVNSAGNRPFFRIRPKNKTTNELGEMAYTSVPNSGDIFEASLVVNVSPGFNHIVLAVQSDNSEKISVNCTKMVIL